METPFELLFSFNFLVVFMLVMIVLLIRDASLRGMLSSRPWVRATIVLALWAALTGVLSYLGVFKHWSFFPPPIALTIAVPVIGMIFLVFNKTFTRIIDLIPAHMVLLAQSFRIVVEIILWRAYLEHLMPIQMTFEGFNFDIIIGITAPFIAWMVYKNQISRSAVIIWNIGGLLILGTVVAIALLSAPTEMRIFTNEPSTAAVAEFPFTWLPAILVNVAVFFHLVSLRQMRNKGDYEADPVTPETNIAA